MEDAIRLQWNELEKEEEEEDEEEERNRKRENNVWLLRDLGEKGVIIEKPVPTYLPLSHLSLWHLLHQQIEAALLYCFFFNCQY